MKKRICASLLVVVLTIFSSVYIFAGSQTKTTSTSYGTMTAQNYCYYTSGSTIFSCGNAITSVSSGPAYKINSLVELHDYSTGSLLNSDTKTLNNVSSCEAIVYYDPIPVTCYASHNVWSNSSSWALYTYSTYK